MNARSRGMAVGAVAAAIIVPGAIRYYQVTRPIEGDLVITGQTSAETPVVASRNPSSIVAPEAQPPPSSEPATARFAIHVAGAVRKPGVYRLTPGMRAEDAINVAGGVTESADVDSINLAARVEDGQQLFVPRKGETARDVPRTSAGAPTREPIRTASGWPKSNKLGSPGEGTVNINTASAEELQRLPRVGPATAARIIEHRKTNGRFNQPEGLMDISGIGPKTFEKMKPFVRVQ